MRILKTAQTTHTTQTTGATEPLQALKPLRAPVRPDRGGEGLSAGWRRWVASALALQVLLVGALAIPAGADVFGVNQINDATDAFPGDGECWTGGTVVIGGFGVKECSLRAAIQEANSFSGADSIVFSSALAVDVFGTIVIAVSSALPQITDAVTIDGTTAPSYDGGSPNPVPVIELSGPGLGSTVIYDGLGFGESADFSVVRGLSIGSFPGDGISLDGADNVLIDANHIGLRRGDDWYGNRENGIRIAATSIGTRVGTTFDSEVGFLGAGNVISGNQYSGISVGGANTRVSGNRIGTDRFGNQVLDGATNFGNRATGISVGGEFAANTEIGRVEQLKDGTWVASGNAISGNSYAGMIVGSEDAPSPNISIRGNSIGIGLDGTTALGNGQGSGIFVGGGSDGVQIGEVGVGGNIIGGHQENGIEIGRSFIVSATRTKVIGNRIGRSADGTSTLPDGDNGIFVNGGTESEIAYNEISGGLARIRLEGDDNYVYANYVGTDSAGLDLVEGDLSGIGIVDSGDSNEIGSDLGLGNIIGFGSMGIFTEAVASSSLIRGNYVGTDEMGRALGNRWGMVMHGANARVGGSLLGEGNTIGFNQADGLSLDGATSGNVVLGNFVGTNAAGEDLGNGENGIELGEAFFNTIGSNTSTSASFLEARKNVIAFNQEAGVALSEASGLQTLESVSNAVRGNVFKHNGTLAIDLGAVGPTGNDPGDVDLGHNNLQNAPAIDPAQTSLDLDTGLLTIRYSVDSTQANSAYRLVVDFYQVSTDGEEPGRWVGADGYLGTDAQLDKQITITPAFTIPSGSQIVAIATDDEDNSSEASNRVPVPEPGLGMALFCGLAAMTALMRAKSRSGSASVRQRRFGLPSGGSVWIALMASVSLLATMEASAAIFTVNTTDDIGDQVAGDGLCWTGNFISVGGPFGIRECSLRAAIEEANATVAADTIEFWSQLPVGIYGTIVFAVINNGWPQVSETLTVDGTTAPTYDENDPDAVPVVVLDGGLLTNGASSGFFLSEDADFSVIRGLAIIGFPREGIAVFGADQVLIQGNHIGLDRGFIVRGNRYRSVVVSSLSDSVTIGHSFSASEGLTGKGNVISGNFGDGILVQGDNARIAGNRIGTDRFGNSVLGGGGDYGNLGWGVRVAEGAANLQLGWIDTLDSGVRVASGNTIAGNLGGGVIFSGPSPTAAMYANYVGVGADGQTALGNSSGPGVRIASESVTIGEEGIGANVISGHQYDGIQIVTNPNGYDSDGIRIAGNIIGLNATADAVIPNLGVGVAIRAGDLSEVSRNTIGGNAHGILVNGLSHQVHGNFVGTNASGQDLGNVLDGIIIEEAFDTTVGSNVVTSTAEFSARKNVIAFNGRAGVSLPVPLSPLDPAGLFNAIRGNEIHSNGGIPIDLGVTGPNGNDSEDADSGRNNLQNSPQMDPAFTQLDLGTGQVAVRYLVDSEVTEAAYPIQVDFYQVAPDGEEPLHWLGSDLYDASDAMSDRDAVFTPASAVTSLDSIVAVATDDENNSSEVSSVIPLPEPSLATALLCGALGMAAMRSRVPCEPR